MWVFNLLKACYSLSHLSDWIIVHCSHCGVTVVLQCHCACSCSSPKAPKKAASHLWSVGNQSQSFQRPSAYVSNVVLTTQLKAQSPGHQMPQTLPENCISIITVRHDRVCLESVDLVQGRWQWWCSHCFRIPQGQRTQCPRPWCGAHDRFSPEKGEQLSICKRKNTWPAKNNTLLRQLILPSCVGTVLVIFTSVFFRPRRWGVPQIQGVPTNSIEDGKHTRLKGVPEEHLGRWHLWFSTFSWGLF